MANNEKVYLMKLPQITPEQYMRNCYINLANLTSSAEALSDLKMSETIQMPTVTIKHTFFVDAAYTAQIGREEVDQEVVHETHKHDDGTTYEKAVIKETTRIGIQLSRYLAAFSKSSFAADFSISFFNFLNILFSRRDIYD